MHFRERTWSSVMWVGLIQAVEGLKNKARGFLEKKEFCPKTAVLAPA